MKKFWIAFAVIIVVLGGGVVGLYWLTGSLGERATAAGGVLHWRIDGGYPEERDTSLLALALEGYRPVQRDVVFALARAAADDRITGLLLDIRALETDWAKVEELREAVAAFARTGKPVAACLESGAEKEYALALAAGRIAMPPEGMLMVLGVSAELSFLKGTLDKLGMEADFVHIGRYKSAPEALTRREPSAPHREMIESIVDEHYASLVSMIAAGRAVTHERARGLIDDGPHDALDALSAGLVDTLLTLEEAEDCYFPDAAFLPLEDYAARRGRGRTAGKAALVYATGTITPGETRHDDWLGKNAGSETVVEHLRRAREDGSVGAVILRIDSPGGSSLASDLIWTEVARTRAAKPVVVSMSGYAASGGYYIACGADSIFAGAATLTGSIGVFAGKVDLHGFYAKLGVDREHISRGRNALLFGDHARFTAEQRARLESLLGDFYARFVDKVATGRGLSPDSTAALAEGRVWTGAQARDRGLVDGLGGLPRAVAAVKSALGVAAHERIAIVTYDEPLSFFQRMLLRSLRPGSGDAAALAPWPAAAIADGALIAARLMDGRPLALLPLRIDFP